MPSLFEAKPENYAGSGAESQEQLHDLHSYRVSKAHYVPFLQVESKRPAVAGNLELRIVLLVRVRAHQMLEKSPNVT